MKPTASGIAQAVFALVVLWMLHGIQANTKQVLEVRVYPAAKHEAAKKPPTRAAVSFNTRGPLYLPLPASAVALVPSDYAVAVGRKESK